MAKYTPMMEQYLQIKEKYKYCLLFYRLGDFYELFFEDALIASRELEITLTGKDCGMPERAPMCGVPFHSADGYIAKLVEKGYKVAICEQVEDPKKAKGLVKREVIRIITPGTVLDTNVLDEGRNNYIMCIYQCKKGFGIAACDVSTGEFAVTSVSADAENKVIDEIARFNPSELIANEDFTLSDRIENIFSLKPAVERKRVLTLQMRMSAFAIISEPLILRDSDWIQSLCASVLPAPLCSTLPTPKRTDLVIYHRLSPIGQINIWCWI